MIRPKTYSIDSCVSVIGTPVSSGAWCPEPCPERTLRRRIAPWRVEETIRPEGRPGRHHAKPVTTLSAMRVLIDEDRCTGHGRCYSLVPDLFDADDQGHGTAL